MAERAETLRTRISVLGSYAMIAAGLAMIVIKIWVALGFYAIAGAAFWLARMQFSTAGAYLVYRRMCSGVAVFACAYTAIVVLAKTAW